MTPDPGAAAERTRLAWRRTGLTAAVAGLLAVRPAFAPDAGVFAILLAAAAMAAWATMISLALRRGASLGARPPRPARRLIVVYAMFTVGFAVIGGLVVTL
jgi:uncharacterized membrane protein YidH (DUF202 family)